MANTLTGLIPVMYQGLDVVSRENVGAIMAVTRNADAAQVAVGQKVTTPIVPVATSSAIVPGATSTSAGGQAIGKVDMTITDSEKVEILWTGEEVAGVAQYEKIMQDQFAQAYRVLTNKISTAVIAEAVAAAAGGDLDPTGTNPFDSETTGMQDFATVNQSFRDAGLNGQAQNMVLTSGHYTNLQGKMPNLYKANEAGSDAVVTEGVAGRIQGCNIYDSYGFGAGVDSLAFTPQAIQLLTRTPYSGTDQALDRQYVTDTKSGLVFEVSLYAQYRQLKIEVAIAWGVKTIRADNVFKLLNVAA